MLHVYYYYYLIFAIPMRYSSCRGRIKIWTCPALQHVLLIVLTYSDTFDILCLSRFILIPKYNL